MFRCPSSRSHDSSTVQGMGPSPNEWRTRSLGVPLAFGLQQAQHSCVTPSVTKHKPTAGARRAASQVEQDPSRRESTAELIDRETGLRELVDILEGIIAEAGDLIDSRSPELVARARDVLRHSSDESPRQAE
jgi:hypothetical protein